MTGTEEDQVITKFERVKKLFKDGLSEPGSPYVSMRDLGYGKPAFLKDKQNRFFILFINDEGEYALSLRHSQEYPFQDNGL